VEENKESERGYVELAFLESKVPQKELWQKLYQDAQPVLGFYIMLSLSTLIATLGLLSNSSATIIGAMIIAPLMNPIVALAYGIGRFKKRLSYLSMISLSSGIVVSILISYLTTSFIGLSVTGSEILSRVNPTLLDLGVAIGAGAAATFAYTRKSIANSISGAAIAVALVPPLCVVGIGLSIGKSALPDVGSSFESLGITSGGYDIALGAFLLFAANLSGMVLTSQLIFIFQRYGNFKTGLKGMLITIVVILGISYPLGISFKSMYSRNIAITQLTKEANESLKKNKTIGTLEALNVYYSEDILTIYLKGVMPLSRAERFRQRANEYRELMEKKLEEPVKFILDIRYVEMERIELMGESK
jgi:uncharacterized hydrophobic protein (TIGR00271 family)